MGRGVSNVEDQDKRYSDYAAFGEEKYYILKVLEVTEKLKPEGKSLEIGCADGSFSEKLKKKGLDAYGIDISRGAIEKANKKGIKALAINAETGLPFEDNEFDLVVATEVIEHIYDTDFLIKEMNRVVKRGGHLVISTPNLASLVNRAKLLLGKYPSFVPEYKVGGAGHIRAYTLSVLKQQLEEHGFKVKKAVSPNVMFPMANKTVPKLLKKIAFRIGDYLPTIGSHIIICARKR